MPYGYNDWLALTEEPTLEPDLPICDPHHHFWDRRPGSVPYQRYLLHELNADIYSGHNIRSTVFLEARSMYRAGGPEELRPVGEVEFVQGLAAASASGVYGESRAAAAIMGHADLKLGAGVTPVLEALQAASPNRFRGIRHNITWNTDPTWDNRENEGIVNDAKFIEGAKVLSQMGLSLDIMQSFPQLPEIAAFAKAVPDLPIIVNHVGGVSRVGIYDVAGVFVEELGKNHLVVHLVLHFVPALKFLRLAKAKNCHVLHRLRFQIVVALVAVVPVEASANCQIVDVRNYDRSRVAESIGISDQRIRVVERDGLMNTRRKPLQTCNVFQFPIAGNESEFSAIASIQFGLCNACGVNGRIERIAGTFDRHGRQFNHLCFVVSCHSLLLLLQGYSAAFCRRRSISSSISIWLGSRRLS